MVSFFQACRIAIIGGGKFCKALLELMFSELFQPNKIEILGVADRNAEAPGLCLAQKKGIWTTRDFAELYTLENLQAILELTGDYALKDIIKESKPAHIKLIDHVQARSIWSLIQIEKEKRATLALIQSNRITAQETQEILLSYSDRIAAILMQRNARYEEIERNLIRSQRAMSQIIQGSSIPTFMINKDHIVTHWNKACERLTGYPAAEMVGSDGQWRPFRAQKRPIMADLILDGVSEAEVWRYYGTRWRKSALVEGAYEAEEFFPSLGQTGKWLFFTAAPIKAPDGSIIGAIETLWDKTADKKAEEQRERHTRELAESERTMSQIIQGSTIPTFVINAEHVITHWNKALEKLSGYRAEEMVGTKKQWVPFWEQERPSMADVIIDQIEEDEIRKLYGGKWRRSALIEGAYEAEIFFPNLGENGRYCFFTAAPIKGPEAEIIGAIETLQDTTEDKKAEQEKERFTRELSALCSIYTALSAPLDIEERVRSALSEVKSFLCADTICIYLRRPDGRFCLEYDCGLSHPACEAARLAAANSIIHKVAHTGKLAIYDALPQGCIDEPCFAGPPIGSVALIPISSKEGSTFGVMRIGSLQSQSFSHAPHNVLQLIGNRLGVAIENDRLQKQVIRSEEKYRTLFNNAPSSSFILDSRSFEIIDINQRTLDSYGYLREELLGRSFLSLIDPNDEDLRTGLKTISNGQSLLFTKKRHHRKDGQPFYVTLSISHAQYGTRDVLIVSTNDITDSVKRETQLIQASKMTTLGQMAAGIAHEINQPLNVIQVCADFLVKMMSKGQRLEDREMKTLADDIGRNVQRATGIVKHMRDFARQSEVIRNKVDLNAPIRDVFKVLNHELKNHRVRVALELDPNLPSIMAEHNRLEQVFINIVTNAIDAMNEREQKAAFQSALKQLTIKTFVDRQKVVAMIGDTGVGMSKEVLEKIYEPFFTTKEVGKGTGLGVSISYGIIKDYDGEIEIDSKVGRGTIFIVKFPAVAEEPAQSYA